MTILTILYTIFIMPLQLFFEIVYSFAFRLIGDPGLAIIVLSLAMNFLVLPLYKRADAMQEKERDVQKELHDGVAHIKKSFSGDERMMMLNTYYRQKGYKQSDSIKGSVSLFIEIPFFIAAYLFLSNLQILQGVSFGPIANLGAPDGMIVIGGFAINVLPFIMTGINIVSCAIFTKGHPLKTKIQLYAMAIFFFIFLYTSPSGLVFYWTLNNVFALVKTIFYKLKNPKFVLAIMSAVTGVVLIIVGAFFFDPASTYGRTFIIVLGFALLIPLALIYIRRNKGSIIDKIQTQPKTIVFALAAILMTVLVGVLIPSAVISASPQEFVDVTYYQDPLLFILSSACLAFGTFVVWFGVFYWLASSGNRVIFERAMWIACGVALVDYMLFGTNLGTISSALIYDNGLTYDATQMIINALVAVAVGVVMYLIMKRFRKVAAGALATGIIAVAGMSVVNIAAINDSVAPLAAQAAEISSSAPQFTLSTTGKNVVVLMMDKAIGPYIPYLFNEKPELAKQFAGFTYYSNTVSFGPATYYGSPALYGGYEYMPSEMNKRNDTSMKDKQNEALRVIPYIFDDNGYDVTVCDPTFANYQWVPDLSIYSDHPDIQTYITKGYFAGKDSRKALVQTDMRNFFCFGLMKALPLGLQRPIYNNGNYNHFAPAVSSEFDGVQTRDSVSTASGYNTGFMDAYTVLENLPEMTDITDDDTNTALMMSNDTTHDVQLLQEPDYTPEKDVDNTEYDEANTDRFTVDGRTMSMLDWDSYDHYQSDMAALIQIGNWLDYLRENGVYDNTRIIIVADHGYKLDQFDELKLDNLDAIDSKDGQSFNAEAYAPLLLVKDFDSTEFTTSDTFMTNADVPTLATSGLIDNPTNPSTGNAINSDAKNAKNLFVIGTSNLYSAPEGTQFTPNTWLTIHDNIWNKDNWGVSAVNSITPKSKGK